MRLPDAASIQNILLLEFSRIGDTLIHEPTLRALKAHYPQAKIYALCDPANLDMLITHPAIFQVEVFDRKIKTPKDLLRLYRKIKAIRHKRFDLLVNFYLGGITPTLARFSGIPWRLGFNYGQKIPRTHNLLAKAPSGFSNWSVEFAELLRPLGLDPASIWPEPHFFLPLEEDPRATAALPVAGHYAAYNLATSNAVKCWPVEHYAALAAAIYREHKLTPVLISNPGEQAKREAFLAHYPPELPLILLPEIRLRTLAEVLKKVQLLISGDTGIMHLGFALQVPTLAIFTYKPPEYAVSATALKMVVFRQDDAAPPLVSGQKYGVFALSVKEVQEALDKLLAFSVKSL